MSRRDCRLAARLPSMLILAGLLSVPVSGQGPTANVNDGHALKRECVTALQRAAGLPDADRDPVERGSDMGQCLGLVSGVWHTHMMMVDEFGSESAFCPTESISAGEMARIVTTYLESPRARLEEWDTVLILQAFMTRYPCS